MLETGTFGLVGGKPIDSDYTGFEFRHRLRRRPLDGKFERGLGAVSTSVNFVPASEIHNGPGWDKPESTHGVVDGHTAIPSDWLD